MLLAALLDPRDILLRRLSGWLQQQHSLFFSSSCCLRVLLAFELLMHYYVARLQDPPRNLHTRCILLLLHSSGGLRPSDLTTSLQPIAL